MKNYLFFLLVFFTGFYSYSQTTLTQAVDFTVTDVHGNEHNLFSYLDDGKYVLIDFFYTTCGPCQQTAPKVSETFLHFGCNNHDLVVLGIDKNNTDAQVIAFDDDFGAIYPAISGNEGGGNMVVSAYGITMFPTVILIQPDHQIVEQDIWPIADGAYLISVITPYGPQSYTCSNEAEITSFSLSEQTSDAVISDNNINIEVENGTDVSNLIPVFSISDYAVAKIGEEIQTSGVSVVDFSEGTVEYTILAEDATTLQTWNVTVDIANSVETNYNIISIFPNPATDFFNVSNAKSGHLYIYDNIGKLIIEKDIKTNNEYFSINELASGFYNIQIVKENKIRNFKITVSK